MGKKTLLALSYIYFSFSGGLSRVRPLTSCVCHSQLAMAKPSRGRRSPPSGSASGSSSRSRSYTGSDSRSSSRSRSVSRSRSRSRSFSSSSSPSRSVSSRSASPPPPKKRYFPPLVYDKFTKSAFNCFYSAVF